MGSQSDNCKTGKKFVGHPKWDVKVMMLIANPPGRTSHLIPRKLQASLRNAASKLGCVAPTLNDHFLDRCSLTYYAACFAALATFRIPRKLRQLTDRHQEDADEHHAGQPQFSEMDQDQTPKG
jgi:hypothetical protein